MLTPKQIVEALDRYIIGQDDAKRTVAIALRNRYRRSRLPEELREEIIPKNIIMMGPTGVGKTEIARRLAKLVDAPFVKVEATKFTEVGYVGRDVDSMVRDLVEASIRLVKSKWQEKVRVAATAAAEQRIVDILAGMHGSNVEDAKALAYRLYTLAERKGWTNEAYAYNNLIVAWPDIMDMVSRMRESGETQYSFGY